MDLFETCDEDSSLQLQSPISFPNLPYFLRAIPVISCSKQSAIGDLLFQKHRMIFPLLIKASHASEWPLNSRWNIDYLEDLSPPNPMQSGLPHFVKDDTVVDVLVAKDGRNFLKLDLCTTISMNLKDALLIILRSSSSSSSSPSSSSPPHPSSSNSFLLLSLQLILFHNCISSGSWLATI